MTDKVYIDINSRVSFLYDERRYWATTQRIDDIFVDVENLRFYYGVKRLCLVVFDEISQMFNDGYIVVGKKYMSFDNSVDNCPITLYRLHISLKCLWELHMLGDTYGSFRI